MKKQFTIFLILIFVFGLTPIDFSVAGNLSDRLKGRILLQVESNGEAWYVSPDNSNRYFLGRPADAFSVMRELGLGISNKDFDSFNNVAPKRLSGKILLKVEDSGKAYYVNPDDLKMHFLGRPADAFKVMRELGLGISNNNLNKISISGNSTLPLKTRNNATNNFIEEKNESEKKEEIQSANISDYITSVVAITCLDDNASIISDGSGSLWNFGIGFEYTVLTNKHVIMSDHCYIHAEDITFQNLDNTIYTWNTNTDVAVLKIEDPDQNMNFKISLLDKCDTEMDLATPMYIIGYPAFATTKNNWLARTITEGIISAHNRSNELLLYPNYYISSKIDSGNSGGIALAKSGNNYCVLGIPTWLSVENYETQGIVQNIHNIMNK
ncbi:trypsin-like peptidase domain-containing protein [Candidatus Parcubacteria bacterium]|nr:trypsin-like peptidase domain-containing protein [Candidatus Parcubacteria bacterium]